MMQAFSVVRGPRGGRRFAVVVALAASAFASSGALAATLAPIDPAALQATLEGLAKEMNVPGAVVLLRTPAGEYVVTYGVRSLGGTEPVTAADHIRIGSNTKTWTGTAILQLVEEGKIALGDSVSKYRPEVPNGDNITIEQLLNMRSGLFNYSTTFALNQALDAEPLKVWQPEELLAISFAMPPYFAPDQGYRYSNANTVLLGLIAEQLDGKPLEAIFQDRIFGPLGLADTLLPAKDSNAMPAPYARGYMYTDNLLTLATNAIPPDLQFAADKGELLPNDQTDANPSWGWAAGAGISTAEDLADYVEALTNGRLLGPEMQALRLASPRPTSDAPGAALYGLGIGKFGTFYGHTGELPGYNTFMGADPENHVTLIVWTNLAPAADGRDPATTIARDLIGQIFASQ